MPSKFFFEQLWGKPQQQQQPSNKPMTAMDALRMGGRSLHTVNIEYTDVKGTHTSREVEPYSLRPGKDPGSLRIMAYDPAKDSIRGFRMDRVSRAEVTQNTYVPRWNMEL